ncbi:hypothetical protein HK103_006481 [Boothiomyces macroporosus]|uniref:Uncharacterized protein n=1 Tax=Boothiomyces macroporosus TaxID=261099 RepID=A0AAD5UNW7_9FUNG|nr:hypothetical protein HK103_006481 [Boothiomyces macroporosus]
MDPIQNIFNAFCHFGTARNASSDNLNKNTSASALNSGPMMDGSQFSKFCKDCNITKLKVTTTDVDIIFNKIDEKQFREALNLLSQINYPGQDNAFDLLVASVVQSGGTPKLVPNVTTPVNKKIVSKLTDTSLYTGTHKNRFDEHGKGLGMAGKDKEFKELSQITNRKDADVRGVQK